MQNMTISQARAVRAAGNAVVMDGDAHSFFIVKDEREEDADVKGQRVP